MARKYMWVSQTAEKWGVSRSWVYRLCRQGRVSGAFFRDGRWSVPADAPKPLPQPSQRIKRLQSKRITLPESLPLRFFGDGEGVPPVTEKLFSECAEYVISFVDLAPGNGKTLFCALSYPHIKAMAICESGIEYAFLSSLKNDPRELYSRLSMMLFEYTARQSGERREYYGSVKSRLTEYDPCKDATALAACAIFLCRTSVGGELIFGENGEPICEMRRKYTGEICDISEFYLLSELLSRADIYPNCEILGDESNIPEYSAIHISPSQDESGEYDRVTGLCERVFVL